MTNYIPHHTKKRTTLLRREEDLRRLIKLGVEEQKLICAAEEVKAARIRALEARLRTLPSKYDPTAVLSRDIIAKIEALRLISVETILAEFGIHFKK